MAEGYTFYDGHLSDINRFLRTLDLKLPLYTNPAEYLIGLATNYKTLNRNLELS